MASVNFCSGVVLRRNLNCLEQRDLGLAGAVPAEVGALSALTVLWLFNNELSGLLPEKLGDLMR